MGQIYLGVFRLEIVRLDLWARRPFPFFLAGQDLLRDPRACSCAPLLANDSRLETVLLGGGQS